MKILLIHPAVYDFACHDFWLKPYGLLKLAGLLQQKGIEIFYFDFLDRYAPDVEIRYRKSDAFGKGRLPRKIIPKPDLLSHVPRRFKRYGRDLGSFLTFLKDILPVDAVMMTCTMTYWYPGVKELLPYLDHIPTYLGGGYASLYPEHAESLNLQVVTHESLPDFLSQFDGTVEELHRAVPYWEAYSHLPYIVTRLSWGCPCHCTYCAVPSLYPRFIQRTVDDVCHEIAKSLRPETNEVVFYDDALLEKPSRLNELCQKALSLKKIRFHTPNGLSINQMTNEITQILKECHFSQIYLGYETADDKLQKKVGQKTSSESFGRAIKTLKTSSYPLDNVHSYLLMGHDLIPPSTVEKSIEQVHRSGIRPLLAEYSPISGTADGDRILERSSDPILTNKTSCTYRWADPETIRHLKALAHSRIL